MFIRSIRSGRSRTSVFDLISVALWTRAFASSRYIFILPQVLFQSSHIFSIWWFILHVKSNQRWVRVVQKPWLIPNACKTQFLWNSPRTTLPHFKKKKKKERRKTSQLSVAWPTLHCADSKSNSKSLHSMPAKNSLHLEWTMSTCRRSLHVEIPRTLPCRMITVDSED